MLGKGVDRDQRLFASRALPICTELIAMEAGPLAHKGQLLGRERTLQNIEPVDGDRNVALGKPGVEMRPAMLFVGPEV